MATYVLIHGAGDSGWYWHHWSATGWQQSCSCWWRE